MALTVRLFRRSDIALGATDITSHWALGIFALTVSHGRPEKAFLLGFSVRVWCTQCVRSPRTRSGPRHATTAPTYTSKHAQSASGWGLAGCAKRVRSVTRRCVRSPEAFLARFSMSVRSPHVFHVAGYRSCHADLLMAVTVLAFSIFVTSV